MVRTFTQFGAILAMAVFFIACGNDAVQQQPPTVATQSQQENLTEEPLPEDEYWAKDNFDLQRVGPVLRRSRNIEEFERYLNDDDGINNLDLNGDGYADYISVDEFDYGDDPNQRGLSLYSRFGPDMIQEIARVLFYRDQPNYPGSRVLLYGNEEIYGDDQYYETNWLDQTVGLVSNIFGDRGDRYRSPYYYDNYPDWYDPYYIVETPVYRTRVERLYPEPVFVYTAAPAYLDRITIRSPHDGQWIEQVHAKLKKPKREQEAFLRDNPVPPARGRRDRADGPGFSEDAPGQRKKVEGEQRAHPDRGNPNKPDKADKVDKNQGGPPARVEPGPPRDNPGRAKGNPNKPDNQVKADFPNKGGGNGKGGNNGKGGGGGKGKGKP